MKKVRIASRNKAKLCNKCFKPFKDWEWVIKVSEGSGNPKYYHEKCAPPLW